MDIKDPKSQKMILAAIAVAGLGYLYFFATFVPFGYRAMASEKATLQGKYEQLSSAVARQRTENARLREEARRLRDDPTAIEELARRELGLIRPGEKVFIVKDLKSPTTP